MVRLHKEHGLNPTIAQCFFCGAELNEIALLGATYKSKAPKNMVVSMRPCDECARLMSMGVLLIEVKDGSQKDKNPYRTGQIWVITDDAAQRAGLDPVKQRFAFIEEATATLMGMRELKPIYDEIPEERSS